MSNTLKILHAPRNTANQATIATEALRELRHTAESWDFGVNPFQFKADKSFPSTVSFEERFKLLNEAIEKFDIFHFHSGNTLLPSFPQMLPYWDLPILKSLGKKVFMHFHGSDLRVPSIHKQINPYANEFYKNAAKPDEQWLRDRFAFFQNFCDGIFVSSHELLDYAPNAQVVPRALDVRLWEYRPAPQNRPVKIIHAPSKRGTKGTDLVLKGIEELKAKGLEFDFALIENVPHNVLKAEIERADIVIDQFVMGDCCLISFEAMTAGTIPVAFIGESVQKHLPTLPVYNVNPSDFVQRMENLIKDKDLMRKMARHCREYALQNHSKQRLGQVLEYFYTNTPIKPFNKTQVEWVSRNMDQTKASLNKRVVDLERTLGSYQSYNSSLMFKMHKKLGKLFEKAK